MHNSIENHTAELHRLFVMRVGYVAVAPSSSDGVAIRYALLVFVDDVIFSYHGASWPESSSCR